MHHLPGGYYVFFGGSVMVKSRCPKAFNREDEAQVHQRTEGLGRDKLGMLLNFGGPRLDYRRLVFNLRPAVQYC